MQEGLSIKNKHFTLWQRRTCHAHTVSLSHTHTRLAESPALSGFTPFLNSSPEQTAATECFLPVTQSHSRMQLYLKPFCAMKVIWCLNMKKLFSLWFVSLITLNMCETVHYSALRDPWLLPIVSVRVPVCHVEIHFHTEHLQKTAMCFNGTPPPTPTPTPTTPSYPFSHPLVCFQVWLTFDLVHGLNNVADIKLKLSLPAKSIDSFLFLLCVFFFIWLTYGWWIKIRVDLDFNLRCEEKKQSILDAKAKFNNNKKSHLIGNNI